MRFAYLWVFALCFGCLGGYCLTAHPAAPEPHRSPIDLAILPVQRALTANHTSNSVSLVDLTSGKVLAEQACERKPVAVACSRDGKRAVVSNLWSGTVSFLHVEGHTVKLIASMAVGAF